VTVTTDAALLPDHLDSVGVHGNVRVSKGWRHIRANLTDAALQRRQDYKAVVRPRVKMLLAA
jgi:hypothetical protein